MGPANPDLSTAANPHCPLHPHFTNGCPSCSRAGAAFQPYQLAGKAELTSRSFQNAGPSLIIPEPPLSGADLLKVVAAESIVDLVLGALFNV